MKTTLFIMILTLVGCADKFSRPVTAAQLIPFCGETAPAAKPVPSVEVNTCNPPIKEN